MSYGFFSKYDREVVGVFQIREHHAKIVKLGRYELLIFTRLKDTSFGQVDSIKTLVCGRASGNFSLARPQKSVARGVGLSDLIIPGQEFYFEFSAL